MIGIPYKNLDGLGLAELVKRKEIHQKELIEEAITTIESLNPNLNAVINKMYEQARKAANENLTGTFSGVPMLLKDIAQEIEAEPITSGSKAYQSYRAKMDSGYVQQLRKTGVIFLGQTNVPEFGLMGVTEPSYYGATRNPWDFNHNPGGSSGGAAAA